MLANRLAVLVLSKLQCYNISETTVLCQMIWETKKWPKVWTQSLITPLSKKGKLKQCQSYHTIIHSSQIMLRVILNRLTAKDVKLLAEEQAGSTPSLNTVKQMFNSRAIIEKHLKTPARYVQQFHRLQEGV